MKPSDDPANPREAPGRRRVLHIVTRPDDALARDVIARQRTQAGCAIQVVDLTQAGPDYDQLLDAIFTADSIQVW